MRKVLLGFYGLLSLTGVLLLLVIIRADIGEGMGYGLAPDVFPNLISGLFLTSALTLFFQELRKMLRGEPDTEASPLPPGLLLHLALCAGLFFGAFPLMRLLGFVPGGMLIMLGLQLVCGARKPLTILLASGLTPLLALYALGRLGVPLP